MNIFEFLGLAPDHRKEEKVTQLVKHYDEVPDSKKSDDNICMIKYDGVHCLVVVKDCGETKLFSRTGKMLKNVDAVTPTCLIPGVYSAELCCDVCSLEELSGIINPNRVKKLSEEKETLTKKFYLKHFDLLTISGFIRGEISVPYGLRYNTLRCVVGADSVAQLLDGEDFYDILNDVVSEGHEGIIIRGAREGWVAGHKGYRCMKLVGSVSYDLECIGLEEGVGKYKGCAKLLFRWKDGKTIKAMLGKGWSYEDARCIWESREEHAIVGEIYEVYALRESSKGMMRQPKVGEHRHDKTESDY